MEGCEGELEDVVLWYGGVVDSQLRWVGEGVGEDGGGRGVEGEDCAIDA